MGSVEIEELLANATPSGLCLLNWVASEIPFEILVLLEDAKRQTGVVRLSISFLEESRTDVQRLRETLILGHMVAISTTEGWGF